MACGVYYYAWIFLLPKIGKYEIKQEILIFADGSSSHALVKVPYSELERWDEKHDAHGRLVIDNTSVVEVSATEKAFNQKASSQSV